MISRSRVVEAFSLAITFRKYSLATRSSWQSAKCAAVLAAGLMVSASGLSAQSISEKPYYLRFGGVVEYAKDTRFVDVDCKSPRHNHGCGIGPDGLQRGVSGEFGTAGGFEVGFGYRPAPGFRLEGIVQSRPPFNYKGQSNYLKKSGNEPATAEVSTLSVMAAVFFDFADTISMPFGDFRPYFGSGVGFSRNEISETKIRFPNTTTTIPSGRTNSIATFFSVGILMPVSETITLDIGWRYTDLGRVDSGPGSMLVHNNNDGSLRVEIPDRAKTRGRLRSSGLAMSLIVPF